MIGLQTPLPPWLDEQTSALVIDLVATLAQQQPDVLALILFGSVARHDERPLGDPAPSDVDLLVLFARPMITFACRSSAPSVAGDAYRRHLDAPREVNLLFVSQTLEECDPQLLANIACDGIVLFARGIAICAMQGFVTTMHCCHINGESFAVCHD